jgi:ATP-dependent DNA helicase DinG
VPQIPAVPGTASLIDAVHAVFAPDGALAQAAGDEGLFEVRPAQREMAAAVAQTLAEGGTLLVEAGTGTGKTLAYLVPAILSRKRVLVSTGTKNLQEQIFFKDLPALRAALGVPFTATYMKGRANYLCLHRFDTFRERPLFKNIDERVYLRVVEEWAAGTTTGDRAELSAVPEELSFWGDISATTEQCIGNECPRFQDCFVTKMRQAAAESDVVIVNHHLLCADAAIRQSTYGEVIPECHYAIVDEAHQLEDVATQYFGYAVSNYRLEELVRDSSRVVGGGVAFDATTARQLLDDIARLQDASRNFFSEVEFTKRQRGVAGEERGLLTRQLAEQIADAGAGLLDALQSLEATIRLARDIPEDLTSIARRASEIRDELARLLRADDPEFVFFVELRGRGVFLRAAPIDVSSVVRELLLDRMHATVLTSATLAVEGSFEYVRARLGARNARGLLLPSEFDFESQAVLYLPRRMPDPRSSDFVAAAAEQVIELLRCSRGRAFVLFTSYAAMREVRARIEGRIEFPLLVQGNAPRSALLQQFRETPNAVLLATSSFWQGVDVAGDALSCVIIDKLPFASPGDPITAARIEAVNVSGGNAFADYQVPLAILALKQGLGRLIRTRRDRGVLAVLDPRLRTMAYGARFLASLPPAPVTHRVADVERFFAP